MQAALKTESVSVADYLAAEVTSLERHEYLGGQVYAMAGETAEHNIISLNLAGIIRSHLKRKPCKTFMNGIRVNLSLHTDEYYYYPDLVVTCDKRDTQKQHDKHLIHHPKLIIEVLSGSTERVDKHEKFFAYTQIVSLEEYILVSQTAREVTVFRRANHWKPEVINGARAAVVIHSLKLKLPLKKIYEGV